MIQAQCEYNQQKLLTVSSKPIFDKNVTLDPLHVQGIPVTLMHDAQLVLNGQ